MRPSPPPLDVVPTTEDPEVIVVDSHRVWCDGGMGALGHPRVYLEMGEQGFVECPYCDRRFVLTAGHGPGSHAGSDEDEALAPATFEGADASPS